MKFLIALFTLLSIDAAVAAAPEQQNPPGSVSHTDDFVIGPQDVLLIDVWREPELTATVTVRPDGIIGLPVLNDFRAGGLTTDELRRQLTEALRNFVAEPVVTVIVLEVHSYIVHVTGSVGRPGTYEIRGPTNVVQLLARAGGLADFAKPREIMIVRSEAGRTRRFRFDFDSFVSGQNYQQNISLRSGDVIIVP